MNVLTLLLILMVGCALCWGVSRLPPPWRTVGIVVVVVLALVVLLSLLGLIPNAFGQEPTPSLDAPAEEVEAPPPELTASPVVAVVPSVMEVDDQQVAVVPAPEAATKEEVGAVAEQASENLKTIAAGDATLAEGTRNPVKSPDAGEDFVWFLTWLFGATVRPVIEWLVEKYKVDSTRASDFNNAGMILFFGAAWLLFRSNPAVPQDVMGFAIWVTSAIGVGSVMSGGKRNLGRSRRREATS